HSVNRLSALVALSNFRAVRSVQRLRNEPMEKLCNLRSEDIPLLGLWTQLTNFRSQFPLILRDFARRGSVLGCREARLRLVAQLHIVVHAFVKVGADS